MRTIIAIALRRGLIAACFLSLVPLAWRVQEVAAELSRERHAASLYGQAFELRLAGRTHEARTAFRQVIILAPFEVGAYGGLADAEFALGQVDAAIETYRRVLSIYPYMYFGDLYRQVGFIEFRARRFEQARRDLTEAVMLNPADWHAYYMLGHVHKHLNDVPAAQSAWRRVLVLHPEYEPARVQLRGLESP